MKMKKEEEPIVANNNNSFNSSTWIDLAIDSFEFRPSNCLTTGQCFNWQPVPFPFSFSRSYSLIRSTGKEKNKKATEEISCEKKENFHANTSFSNSSQNNEMHIKRKRKLLDLKVKEYKTKELQKCQGVETKKEEEWIGVIDRNVFVIRETSTTTLFKCLYNEENMTVSSQKKFLREYFNLNISLKSFYDLWIKSDRRLSQKFENTQGVRIFKQAPLECLFSFICSANNNIKRITSMINSLRREFGDFLCEILLTNPECSSDYIKFELYSFPSLPQLLKIDEKSLYILGFGYRSRSIVQSARMLLEFGGASWIDNLKNLSRIDCKTQLLCLQGVGRKVADCVSLLSLNHLDALPVDTHIFQFALREFDSNLKNVKSISDSIYEEIGDLFRQRYSPYAGWAQAVLFVSEINEQKKNFKHKATKNEKKKKS